MDGWTGRGKEGGIEEERGRETGSKEGRQGVRKGGRSKSHSIGGKKLVKLTFALVVAHAVVVCIGPRVRQGGVRREGVREGEGFAVGSG